jgi:hypothetical protein
MVEEFIGRLADELRNSESDAYCEVVEKYDSAWKELATR